jgi:hypothetical protein
VEGGGLWVQKLCGSKMPLTAPQSCDYIASNPRVARGTPLGVEPCPDPDERSVNEKGVMVETSTHSIIRMHGGFGHEDNAVRLRYPYGQFYIGPC